MIKKADIIKKLEDKKYALHSPIEIVDTIRGLGSMESCSYKHTYYSYIKNGSVYYEIIDDFDEDLTGSIPLKKLSKSILYDIYLDYMLYKEGVNLY